MPEMSIEQLQKILATMSLKDLIRVHTYLGEALAYRYVALGSPDELTIHKMRATEAMGGP